MVAKEIRRIEYIIIGNRFRKDLGDLDSLAKSIAEIGLLHPIAIAENNELVAGQRRLEIASQSVRINQASYFSLVLQSYVRVSLMKASVYSKPHHNTWNIHISSQ
jgi:hypothetical protein